MSKSPKPDAKPSGKKGDPLLPPVTMSTEDSLRELTYLVTCDSQLGIYDEFGTIFERGAVEVRASREVSVQRRIRRKREKALADRAMADEMLRQRNQDVQHLANLKKYGILIQRFMRSYPYRKKYGILKESLKDRTGKRAIVIGIDKYDDSRLRSTTHNVSTAIDIALALQQLNFAVECLFDNSPQLSHRPTRANILRVIEEAKRNDTDMVFVYIACHGVHAPVQGHNPYRAIAGKESGYGVQTPRTRLGVVLQRSINRSKNGGDDVKENVVRALLPCDAKVSRLTFDSVVTLEEVQEVLYTGGPLIHGRRAAQHILCVDTSHFGVYEASQGVGYAFYGASTTRENTWDYVRPAGQDHEQYGLMSLALHKALTLSCSHRQGMTVKGVTKFVRGVMEHHQVPMTSRGSDWGDMSILSRDRAAHFESMIQPTLAYARFLEGGEGGDALDKEDPTTRKMCCMRMHIVVDLQKSERTDFEGTDYLTDITSSVQALMLENPKWSTSLTTTKLQVGCVEAQWTLMIGLNGTFMDVAKAKKIEGNVWDALLVELLGDVGNRTYAVQTGKACEGGLLLAISTTYPADVNICFDNLAKIPHIIGFGHKSYMVKFAMAVFATQPQLEVIMLHSRTVAAVRIQATRPKKEEDPVQDLFRAVRSRTDETSLQVDDTPSLRFSVVDARMLLPRVNDISGATGDSFSRRDKPLIAPSGPMQAGTALFLCAVAGTLENRARQVVEVAKVMHTYQPFRGIVYMYWEDAAGMDTSKEKFVRHLGQLKASVSFPSLLLIDSAKKRNYLLKLWQEKAFFPAQYVTHFSEEYLKGAMSDLLPPVRGSRVYGCGSTNSKFVLIQT